MSFLKYFDLFSIHFHFYSECQAVHHNTFGGIMTILFTLVCISAFIAIEFNDLCQLNPISSKSQISNLSDNSHENLYSKKIWIPFRLVTYEYKFIDHRGILYPMIYLVRGTKNLNGEINLIYTELNYKLCNETSMNNKNDNNTISAKLNELFCIDDENNLIDGYWNNKDVYYLEINLYNCENGINYNEKNSNCTSFNKLLNYYNSSWIFEFFYPVVQFQPTNKNIPIDVVYSNKFYRLSSYTNKVEKLFLKQNILSDDQNIFIKDPKISSFWGVTQFYGDSYFFPNIPDPLIKETNSKLYSLIIYKDEGLIYYTRSYKKILAIFSDIFPVWNILFIIFKKLIKKIKESCLKKNLMGLLFEQTNTLNINQFNERRSSPNSLLKISKLNIINNNNNNQIHNNRKIIDNSFNKMRLSSCLYLNEGVNKSNFLSLNNNNNFKNNNSMIVQKEKIKAQKVNNDSIKNIITSVKSYQIKKLFPFHYFLMDVFLDNLVRPEKFNFVSSKYLIIYNYMSQLYDISTYIQLFKQFNILKRNANFAKILENDSNWKININNTATLQKLKNINIESRKQKTSVVFEDNLFIYE